MHLSVTCPRCESKYHLAAEMRGKRMRCPNPICRAVFEVRVDNDPVAAAPKEARIRFLCTTCKAVMDAPVERASDKIHCLKCGQRLQIPPPQRALTILAPSLGVDGDGEGAPAATDSSLPPAKIATATVAPKPPGLASDTAAPTGRRYYYVKNGQRFGPLLLKQMVELVASHQLCPDDLVWVEGTPNWVAASERSELVPKTQAAVVSAPAPVATLPMILRVEEELPTATSKPWKEEEISTPLGRSSARSTQDDEAIRCPYCDSTQFFSGRRVTTTGWILYACAIINIPISFLLMWVCIGFVTIMISPVLGLIGMVYCRALVNTCGRCRRDF